MVSALSLMPQQCQHIYLLSWCLHVSGLFLRIVMWIWMHLENGRGYSHWFWEISCNERSTQVTRKFFPSTRPLKLSFTSASRALDLSPCISSSIPLSFCFNRSASLAICNLTHNYNFISLQLHVCLCVCESLTHVCFLSLILSDTPVYTCTHNNQKHGLVKTKILKISVLADSY